VAGDADEAHLAGLLGLVQRLDDAALGVGQRRVVVEAHVVDLPQVQVVSLQPPQGLVEHLHRQPGAAAVRADLRHQEHLVALAAQRPAEPVLGAAVPVLPAVVEERDAGVDGLVDGPDGLLHGLVVAEVVAAHPQRRHFDIVPAELAQGDRFAVGLLFFSVGQ
jgi:hypothetical protein